MKTKIMGSKSLAAGLLTSLGIMICVVLSACGSGKNIDVNLDSILPPQPQVAADKLDLLVVMDNSGSMGPVQAKFVAQAERLAQNLSWYDAQVAVITTDNDRGLGGRIRSGVLSNRAANFSRLLREALNVGLDGPGREELFAPAIQALTPPLSIGPNAGFLRDGSTRLILFVTDSEDQGTASLQLVTAQFDELRRNSANKLYFSAFYIPSTGLSSECRRDSILPYRLESVLRSAPSVSASVCDSTYTNGMNRLGQAIDAWMAGRQAP